MSLRLICLCVLLATGHAAAQNALTITEVRTDRATHHALGVQVLISGDTNRNAAIAVRVRLAATETFREAPPLFRVLPETVTGRTVPEQFAGSIFDVAPNNTYEIELVATDPDGGNDTRIVMATTRAWPEDPPSARAVAAANETELRAALLSAQAGDVITIADGTYTGEFVLQASGTGNAPIVIRGATRDGVVLDGQNCGACNVLEIYGSYVHVERLTIRNGARALRFLGTTTANAALGLRIADVIHGIGSAPDQADFTLCDNLVRGRLVWPLVSSDDGAAHNDDQGIRVDGSGHVICHNDISGFGDPMLNFAVGARAYDFYGNDIHEIYGDGTELDRAEGNARLWGNRFTNVYTAVSMQPIYGGPAYVVRNVVLNVADEQVKLKSLGGTEEPSGALIYHNTFVSPRLALNLQTPITQHNFVIANNLFVGPAPPLGARSVEWTAVIDRGVFDGNGHFPDAGYWFGTVGTPRVFATLAEAKAAGVEQNGRVLSLPIFADLATPSAYTEQRALADFALAEQSNAIDSALPMPGINTRGVGGGPDIGARERGCPVPLYGPRPPGSELSTNRVECSADDEPVGGADAGMPPIPPPDEDDGGCCQAPRDARGALALVLTVGLLLTRKRAKPQRRQQHTHAR